VKRIAVVPSLSLLVGASDAHADSRFLITRTVIIERAFNITGCGAVSALRLGLPTHAFNVQPVHPLVGTRIAPLEDVAVGGTGAFARVTEVRVSRAAGRPTVTFRATGSDDACLAADPDLGTPAAAESEAVELAVRYRATREGLRAGHRAGRPIAKLQAAEASVRASFHCYRSALARLGVALRGRAWPSRVPQLRTELRGGAAQLLPGPRRVVEAP
jgi:hypothetical protein